MHWFILSSDTTSLVLVSINSSYGCWIRSCFEMKTGVVSWVPSIHITQKNTLTFRPKKQNGNKCIKTKKKQGPWTFPQPLPGQPTSMGFTVAGSITSSSISCAANIAFVAFMKLLRPTCTMHVCSWPPATIRTTRCSGWLSKKEMDGMTFYRWFWRCTGIFFQSVVWGQGGYVWILLSSYYQLLWMFVSCDLLD